MKNKITKEQFQAYENVRVSGLTNMFNITNVGMLSGLDRETILCIMKNYEELMTDFEIEDKDVDFDEEEDLE